MIFWTHHGTIIDFWKNIDPCFFLLYSKTLTWQKMSRKLFRQDMFSCKGDHLAFEEYMLFWGTHLYISHSFEFWPLPTMNMSHNVNHNMNHIEQMSTLTKAHLEEEGLPIEETFILPEYQLLYECIWVLRNPLCDKTPLFAWNGHEFQGCSDSDTFNSLTLDLST